MPVVFHSVCLQSVTVRAARRVFLYILWQQMPDSKLTGPAAAGPAVWSCSTVDDDMESFYYGLISCAGLCMQAHAIFQ
jgi:hypothetical protein